METAIKALFKTLFTKRYIGGKHTPEQNLIKSKIKWLNSKEQKQFWKEYKKVINEGIILRSKKRTGKDYDWHICLNSRKINEIKLILNCGDKNDENGIFLRNLRGYY